MRKILLELSYLGTGFSGYQVQPDKRTVQAELNSAAKSLFGFDCDIVGCSRTDSGVHANQFFATVTKKAENSLVTDIPIEKVPSALCFYLPSDISVRSARWVDTDFHARYSVRSKEYLYRIYCGNLRDPFEEGRAWHYFRAIDDSSFESMVKASKHFVGTHDFSAFMSSNSSVQGTVRTIYSVTVDRSGDNVYIKISGDGFLYNMVRIIVGTLMAVVEEKIPPDAIKEIINSKDRARAGVTAPPQGLYLNEVNY